MDRSACRRKKLQKEVSRVSLNDHSELYVLWVRLSRVSEKAMIARPDNEECSIFLGQLLSVRKKYPRMTFPVEPSFNR